MLATTGIDAAADVPIKSEMKRETEGSILEVTQEEEEDEGETGNVNGTVSAPPTIESDVFRIQRGAASQPTDAKTASQEANAAKEDKRGEGTKAARLEEGNGILDHLRIVYPSAYNIVLTNPAFEVDQSNSEALHYPVITLDHRSIENCSGEEISRSFDNLLRAAGLNEMFLAEERYHSRQKASETGNISSWIDLLRTFVQKSAPLSVLLVIRMEASVLAAFDSLQKAGTASIDNSEAVAAMVETEDNSGKEKAYVSNETGVENILTQACLPFYIAAKSVEQHASRVPSSRIECSLHHVRDLVPEQFHAELSVVDVPFIFLPFSNVLQCKEVITRKNPSVAALRSWDKALEVAMKTLIDDSKKVEAEEPLAAPVDGAPQSGHVDDEAQGGNPSDALAKKSKKKKKKKVSNASNPVRNCVYSCSVLNSFRFF